MSIFATYWFRYILIVKLHILVKFLILLHTILCEKIILLLFLPGQKVTSTKLFQIIQLDLFFY